MNGLRETICNGLINYHSNNPVCILDDMEDEDYDEMYENTFASEEYIEDKEEYSSSDELYAIW